MRAAIWKSDKPRTCSVHSAQRRPSLKRAAWAYEERAPLYSIVQQEAFLLTRSFYDAAQPTDRTKKMKPSCTRRDPTLT